MVEVKLDNANSALGSLARANRNGENQGPFQLLGITLLFSSFLPYRPIKPQHQQLSRLRVAAVGARRICCQANARQRRRSTHLVEIGVLGGCFYAP